MNIKPASGLWKRRSNGLRNEYLSEYPISNKEYRSCDLCDEKTAAGDFEIATALAALIITQSMIIVSAVETGFKSLARSFAPMLSC